MNTNTITFTDKTSYLAWRAQWRADYAALSQDIRDVKWARWFNASQCKKSEAQEARYKTIAAKHTDKYGFLPQWRCKELAAKATEMLELRKLSKVRAQEQYLAAKATAAA